MLTLYYDLKSILTDNTTTNNRESVGTKFLPWNFLSHADSVQAHGYELSSLFFVIYFPVSYLTFFLREAKF